NDIKEGVEIAMHREGYPADAVDPIKFNKLAYLAIQDLEIPITYGWYKYGPAPVNVRRQDAQPTPKPAEDCRASSQARILTPDNRFRSPSEYSYYFTEDMPEFRQILRTPTKEFLVGFYEDYAPEPYFDIYTASVRLQQVIDEISEDRDWHNEAEMYQQELDDRLSEIKREILKEPTLSEAIDPFFEYSRLLKNVISGAAALNHINPSQQRFVSKLIDYFYGGAWNYVALAISK